MKKNKALTAAFSVFALTMVSMCAIGGTFAKYVTEKEGSDTAKVAKWGVEITVTTYDESLELSDITGKDIDDIHVSGTALAAPGTYGKLVSMSVSGNPEVVAEIEHSISIEIDENEWKVLGDDPSTPETETNFPHFYCPITFEVGSSKVDGLNYVDNYSGLVTDLEGLNPDPVTTVIDTAISNSVTVSWSWPYSGAVNQNDNYDTQLGGSAPSFGISVTTTVTQVD